MDRIENHPILGETPKRKKVTFSYDGKLLEGYEGEPIATALKAAGVMAHRYTAKTHEPRADFQTLCEMIKRTAFKVTRVGQLVAQEASKRLGVPFGIVDLSLAPTPAIGDSVAEILEEIGLERVGAPGTTAALALLNDQVKKGGVIYNIPFFPTNVTPHQ